MVAEKLSTQKLKSLKWLCLMPLLFALAPQANANLITNGSFETVSPSLKNNQICTTDPARYPGLDPGAYAACSAAGWTGEYQLGKGATIGIFGVSFGIPQPDPNGSNALILQTEYGLAPTATQSIDVPSTGLYTLSFYVANRSSPAGDSGPQTISVLLDGSAISDGVFSKLPAAWTLETLDLSANAGAHTLTLEGLDGTTKGPAAAVTAFVDDVSLAANAPGTGSTAPEPNSFSLAAGALIATFIILRWGQQQQSTKQPAQH